MSRFSAKQRTVAKLLILLNAFVGFSSATAQAAMVETGAVISQQMMAYDRDQLRTRLEQQDAVDAMIRLGVEPTLVQSRVNHMTAEELAAFNQQIDEMQAGGSSLLGVVIVVFVILVILDLLGTTNIFPAIKPIEPK